MNPARGDPAALQSRIARAWSAQTSTLWSDDCPARGQCSVTALAVQQLCGGEILKTRTPGGDHFYNRVDGVCLDLTASQFDRAPAYDDVPSTRDEALADTSPEQLAVLLSNLENA